MASDPLDYFVPVVIVPPPVSLEIAKLHLQVTDTDHDTDIAIKLQQASDAVLDYLAQRADASWTELTLPGPVQAAILHMLMYLYDDRGGDQAETQARRRDIWREIEQTLFRFRDPTVA